jgi:hypothetical protein
MKRADKIALLKRVFDGHATELERLRDKRGRPYTEDDRAAQRGECSLNCVSRIYSKRCDLIRSSKIMLN